MTPRQSRTHSDSESGSDIEAEDQPRIPRILRDLIYLENHGALRGVAQIVAERRRQIEIGFTPEHDRVQAGQAGQAGKVGRSLLYMAENRLYSGHTVEAAALLAADIDTEKRQDDGQEPQHTQHTGGDSPEGQAAEPAVPPSGIHADRRDVGTPQRDPGSDERGLQRPYPPSVRH